MNEVGKRYQSKIDSPVSKYGFHVSEAVRNTYAVYSGIPLTGFLFKNKADPFEIRSFLKVNKIGSPFNDLQSGQLVQIQHKI
jgi:hypothetical protein